MSKLEARAYRDGFVFGVIWSTVLTFSAWAAFSSHGSWGYLAMIGFGIALLFSLSRAFHIFRAAR